MDDGALPQFRGLYEFGLDAFQERACDSILSGRGVLVAAVECILAATGATMVRPKPCFCADTCMVSGVPPRLRPKKKS